VNNADAAVATLPTAPVTAATAPFPLARSLTAVCALLSADFSASICGLSWLPASDASWLRSLLTWDSRDFSSVAVLLPMLTWVTCFTEVRSADTSAQTAASSVADADALAVADVLAVALPLDVALPAELHPTRTLIGRGHFVCDMIHQGVGLIAVLRNVRYHPPRQRRHRLWLARHAQTRANEVDMEPRPGCGTDHRVNRKPNSGVSHSGTGADLKLEPVPDIDCNRTAQVRLREMPDFLTVNVDIESSPGPEVTCQQGGRSLDDPAIIDQVQPFEQSVVSNLPLKLGERPAAVLGGQLQPVRQCPPEGRRCRVPASGRHRGLPSARRAVLGSRAWSSHNDRAGSPARSRSQRNTDIPSFLRKPREVAYEARGPGNSAGSP